jgi:hypothetical protein
MRHRHQLDTTTFQVLAVFLTDRTNGSSEIAF